VDYFPKPLDMDRLVERIRQILDRRAGAVPAPA
jgi:DNA-binding response OmpR family regulator